MFKDYGLRMVPIDADQDGMRMESLEREIQLAQQAAADSAGGGGWAKAAASDPGERFAKYNGLVFIVPTFGNPTGATLTDGGQHVLPCCVERRLPTATLCSAAALGQGSAGPGG